MCAGVNSDTRSRYLGVLQCCTTLSCGVWLLVSLRPTPRQADSTSACPAIRWRLHAAGDSHCRAQPAGVSWNTLCKTCVLTPPPLACCPQEAGDSRGSTQGRNFGYEGKLRGGLPRTISAPILAHAAKWAGPHETAALSRCVKPHCVACNHKPTHGVAAVCALPFVLHR